MLRLNNEWRSTHLRPYDCQLILPSPSPPPVYHSAALRSGGWTAGGCQCQNIDCTHHYLDMPAHQCSSLRLKLQWSIMVLRGKRRCLKHETGGTCQKNGENAEEWWLGTKGDSEKFTGMCALAGAYWRLFGRIFPQLAFSHLPPDHQPPPFATVGTP